MSYSLRSTLASNKFTGAINALLFLDDGMRLASGGDDGVLRIWDVNAGDCIQHVRDFSWGQITTLGLFQHPTSTSSPQTVIVGSGRGIVTLYSWDKRSRCLDKRTGVSTSVFPLDESIEAQAVDQLRSKLCVGSFRGQVRLYSFEDDATLKHLWTFTLESNIPRGVFFLGDNNESIVIYGLKPGPASYLDAMTGKLVSQGAQTYGPVGFVALSPDKRMKAVHNIKSDTFSLYTPAFASPLVLTVSTSAGKIKGVVFGEIGKALVCGGDDGFVHIFDAIRGVGVETLSLSQDCSTVYALDTNTSRDYHLIAAAGSAQPAAVYVFAKPTEDKQAMDRNKAIEREAEAARALQTAQAKARAAREAKVAQEAKAIRENQIADLAHRAKLNQLELGVGVMILACLLCSQVPRIFAGFLSQIY